MRAVAAGDAPELPAIAGFTLVRRLGSGAMGDVFQARQVGSGTLVALKIMSRRLSDHPDWVRRFRREIELVRTVRHPHIARAVADGEHQGRLWLALEYVEGPTLAEILRGSGRLAEGDVLAIGRQVGEVLAQVHAATGLVHRDIKPANLILTRTGAPGIEPEVSLIDFGLARSIADEDQSITSTGMVIGTPSYMSPEQVRGDADLGPGTDLYGLGCTMYHLLTGAVPYDGATAALVMAAHLTAPVPDPCALVPDLSPATRHVVMTAMGKEPAQRFPGHAEFVAACDAALRVVARRQLASSREGTPPPLPVRARSATAALIDAATTKIRQRKRVKTTQPVLAGVAAATSDQATATAGRRWRWALLGIVGVILVIALVSLLGSRAG
jgi:serine/threonine-protein kinase